MSKSSFSETTEQVSHGPSFWEELAMNAIVPGSSAFVSRDTYETTITVNGQTYSGTGPTPDEARANAHENMKK